MKFATLKEFAKEAFKQPIYDIRGNKYEMLFRESTMSMHLYLNDKEPGDAEISLSDEYTIIPHLSIVYYEDIANFDSKDDIAIFGVGFYNAYDDTIVSYNIKSKTVYKIQVLARIKPIKDSELGPLNRILYFRPLVKKSLLNAMESGISNSDIAANT